MKLTVGMAGLFGVLGSALCASGQGWTTFIECQVQTDNRDFLTIHSNGSWEYTTDGGNRPFGLCSNGDTQSGGNYSCMDHYAPFPSGRLLLNSLARWTAQVISGRAPRCDAVGYGSNPGSTVSVIEHTDDHVTVKMRDDGGCGSQGRVSYRLRLSYLPVGLPVIHLPPTAIDQEAGTSAQLTVTAEAEGNDLSFQWRSNQVTIAGATGATLAFPSLHAADAAVYDVIVSNGAGSVPSDSARVIVEPPKATLRVLAGVPGTIELHWDAAPGLTYHLLRAVTLNKVENQTNNFSLLQNFLGDGTEIVSVQDVAAETRYYELLVDY